MKKFMTSRLLLIAVALFSVFTFSACSDDDDDNQPADPTITDVVATNPNFSLLLAAVSKAGLADELAAPGNLTVFAPDNEAFAAAGINQAFINSATPQALADILLYHVVGAKVGSANVPASDSVRTLGQKLIFASRNANGVFVNGVSVKTADVAASNGVIHVISNVLIPPTQTIAGIATGSSDFSILVSAVTKAGLVNAISSPGKYTVFAPTNAAFQAAGVTQATIDALSVAEVTAIVAQHVIGTNVYASDLINNATAPTLRSGTTLTIGTNPPSVKVTGSTSTASNVVTTTPGATFNITTTNGVIHVIDRVIL
ncbi:MAG: fasciclin domain-containing protein [Flavipsychrobacter sp.]|nr:fasciclin domain-containing protein [Flavipsychrobacter sp.]